MKELNNPLISIITPFYNVDSYLNETIESVISQEYTNWELILIDDGSTDNSTTIAKSYANRFPHKVFYIEHEKHLNKGASASRNLGLNKASGELLAFLDSDDYWLPRKLVEQINLFQQNPQASVICEATKYWYTWHDSKKNDIIRPVGAKAEKLYFPPALIFLLYPLGKGDSFCTCALIMRKEVLSNIGGFDESFLEKDQLYEDQVLYVKICLQENVYISSICNNFYRQRPDSLVHGLYAQGYYLQGRYFFLKWLKKYLKQNNIKNKKINRMLRKAFLPYTCPMIYNINKKINSVYKRAFLSKK
jgi:glycosyltransferase involved in cell wall biosynthesis